VSRRYDLTPTEVQAITIADLRAQIELMNERLFYLNSELAKFRYEFLTHPAIRRPSSP